VSKEATKKLVENKGFICDNCGKIVVDGIKHKNEEDLCDQCKISYLETKLAEKERQVNVYACEIAFLDNKLAEKYKEIDTLEDKLRHYYEETLNKGICGLCDHLRGEYKADFAIAQLEQTRKLVDELLDNCGNKQYKVWEIFDQQIKKLKEKK
jgi:uncharacterized coiled-coil protein SlyX